MRKAAESGFTPINHLLNRSADLFNLEMTMRWQNFVTLKTKRRKMDRVKSCDEFRTLPRRRKSASGDRDDNEIPVRSVRLCGNLVRHLGVCAG
jgi:hypothetical protein